MSGFSPVSQIADIAPELTDKPVKNDGFFPDIDTIQIRLDARIIDAVTFDRLKQTVIRSMLTINRDLKAWKAEQLKAGYTSLSDVPADRIADQSVYVASYYQALLSLVRADMIERFRDVDTTGKGHKDVDDLTPAIGELKRDARHAIRDILGKTRTTIALI